MTSLDELHEVSPGHRAVAVRHVPTTLDVFATHFPRFPVLPGVLILDDLVSVARLALSGADGPWVLASVRRVRFRHFVQPGDSLEITAEVVDEDAGRGTVRGAVLVEGRRVATVGAMELRRPQAEGS